MPKQIKSFEEMNLSPEILKALKTMGVKKPTAVQAETIMPVMKGFDITAEAPTGTGKTIAFGIPIIECLNPNFNEVQALVVCPTRELCVQIAEEFRSLIRYRGDIRIAHLYGGVPIGKQISTLKRKPHIVVATPGRLLDHMNRKTVFLGNTYTVVLDEADEMLKMGFIDDVKKILNATPKDTQIIMFSATISREVMNIGWEYQKKPLEISVEAEGESQPQIAKFNLESTGRDKLKDFINIVEEFGFQRVMAFCNMRSTTERFYRDVKELGYDVRVLHGDIPQVRRNSVMRAFRDGKFRILAATDVAARGIDIENVDAVFNIDIPEDNEFYVHRIGRTGRAKQKGVAFTFSSKSDEFRLRDIRKYTDSNIINVYKNEDNQIILENGQRVKNLIDEDDWTVFEPKSDEN